MNLTQGTAKSALNSSSLKLPERQRFTIAAFPNWAGLFQHLQAQHGRGLDIEPRGLIGSQCLWPPERRFDIQQLEGLGNVAHFTLHDPVQAIFCSGNLVRPLASNLVAAGSCSLTDIFEHWVGPVEAERLSRAVSEGNVVLWTSANAQV